MSIKADLSHPPKTLEEIEELVVERGWVEGRLSRAVYVSAGNDAKPLTFLHPAFLQRQGAADIAAPNFFVYVDQAAPSSEDRVPITHDDDETKIETVETVPTRVGCGRAHLLRCSSHSNEFGDRTVAILRVTAKNAQFDGLALKEHWTPETFIGICDGCGGFGGNRRMVNGREVPHCENNFDPDDSPPLKLGAKWWVTDHFDEPVADLDPQDGMTFGDPGDKYPCKLTQVAFLSTLWRSKVSDERRLRRGARIFSIKQGLATSSSKE